MPAKPPVLQPSKTRDPAMRLRTLKCFRKVQEMVLEGLPVPEIARFIQEDAKEYGDVNRASLVRTIYRYKDTIPPADFLAVKLPRKHVEALQHVQNGIDEIDELQRLYLIQLKRIEKVVETEGELKSVLFPNLSNDIRLAAEILRTRSQVKQMSGFYEAQEKPDGEGGDSAAGIADVPILERVYESVAPGKVLRDPESVHRVVSALKTVTTLTRYEMRLSAPVVAEAKGES